MNVKQFLTLGVFLTLFPCCLTQADYYGPSGQDFYSADRTMSPAQERWGSRRGYGRKNEEYAQERGSQYRGEGYMPGSDYSSGYGSGYQSPQWRR